PCRRDANRATRSTQQGRWSHCSGRSSFRLLLRGRSLQRLHAPAAIPPFRAYWKHRQANRQLGHAPHSKGPDLPTNGDSALQQNVTDDAAWVAAYTGFEIQIDENAAPDGADKHRTGAVYNVPTGPGGLQNFTAAALLNLAD